MSFQEVSRKTATCLSFACTLALPLRTDRTAGTAAARSDIRHGMAQLVVEQRTRILGADRASIPPSTLLRRGAGESTRGERLGERHLAEELARVQRRMRTQRLREESGSEGEGAGEEDVEAEAPLGRADDWDPARVPSLLDRSQQYAVPPHTAHFELRGWRVHALFERVQRGRGSALQWYEGHVFDSSVEQGQLRLRVLFSDGYKDWWHGLPERTFSFWKASARDP